MGVHHCTDEDWLKFKTPSDKSKTRINLLKAYKQMLCMDDVDKAGNTTNKSLFGNGASVPHRHIELTFKPCKPEKRTRENQHLEHENCLVDDPTNKTQTDAKLQEIIQWLGAPDFILI